MHIAPGHGADDYELGQANGLPLPDTVSADGRYLANVPLFAGRSIYRPDGKPGDANEAVIAAIGAAGGLLARATLVHSYPHSWRSKAPLIFRNTPQWFIGFERNGLRQKALSAIAETRWVPSQGRNRIEAMVESRPDWCVSRQRAWGVPIAVFTHRETGEPLRDPVVVERIATAVERAGADVWFSADASQFLGNAYDPAEWEKVTDIVEVWFDSGSTHAFVLEQRPELRWPADLYLEGSDQHRGWFQSSLIEACGTRGRAPYEAVLTHGFVLDEDGRKMSKSLGNVIPPQQVMQQSGADILRLWVVGSDYSEDVRIGPEILKRHSDAYRRLRNTLRYLLGALDGYSDRERVGIEAMPELERWVLHRLAELDRVVRNSIEAFDFHGMFSALHNFCATDLSAFYFDIRKDRLYCDAPADPRRRAVRTVFDSCFDCLARWLAPIICFTADEAWLARHGDAPARSVHLELFPDVPPEWRDDALGQRWAELRDLRRVATGALELERGAKRLGSSLQAAIELTVPERLADRLRGIDLAELCITSAGAVQVGAIPEDAFTLPDLPEVGARMTPAEGDRASAAGGCCRRSARFRLARFPACRSLPAMRSGHQCHPRSRRVPADAGARARRGGGGRDPRPADQGGGPRHFAGRPFSDRETITSFFNLSLTYNRGISFGLFNDGAGLNALVFSLAAAAIIALLLFWLSRAASPLLAVAIGLIIGGAVGNVIDRLRLGAVVDFLDFMSGRCTGRPSISPTARSASASPRCCWRAWCCAARRIELRGSASLVSGARPQAAVKIPGRCPEDHPE